VSTARTSLLSAVVAFAAALGLAGCVVQDQRPVQRIAAQKATAEIPEAEILDVAVRLFDPNVPQDPEDQEKQGIFPEVRNAESRYIPVEIRDALEGTGQWGQVRVLPRDGTNMDVYVDGKILKSDGRDLELDVTVTDSAGRTWFRRKYQAPADTRAYKDVAARPSDPFENLYNTLANDMLAARQKLTPADRAQLHDITGLRFDADLAPYAFGPYLAQTKGQYTIVRLPAPDDPLLQRLDRVRERDYAFVDTLNEYYTNFAVQMQVPYLSWRKYSYEELEARDQVQREAMAKQVLGAIAVIGGILASQNDNNDTSAGQAASTAAVIGGIYAFKAGLDQRAEIKTHSESLKQLGESFQSEVQPMVVDVEGRTLQLQGSAEQQYEEWRQLLRDLYENETGLPATSPAPAAAAPPANRG
jgi:hypothetical protein